MRGEIVNIAECRGVKYSGGSNSNKESGMKRIFWWLVSLPFRFTEWLIIGPTKPSDYFRGEKLPPGMKYFPAKKTIQVVDLRAYFASIPEGNRKIALSGKNRNKENETQS